MKKALLVMSYGTPERLADVADYYTHIRRGRPPPDDLLTELIERYQAVGGPTALNRITRDQADAIGAVVRQRYDIERVYVGFKHVTPFIGEVVEKMAADAIDLAVGLVLAPHFSLRSIAEYVAYAEKADAPNLTLDIVRSWHERDGFLDGLARRLCGALDAVDPGAHVIFTAHSVPAASVERGDPYPDQLMATCRLVAERAGVRDWTFAYQSAGRTADPWLGPDILDVIAELAKRDDIPAIAVQAIGFVADHLEVLYDLDLEARQVAEHHGLGFARAEMQNVAPDFVQTLAELVVERFEAIDGARDPVRTRR